MEYILRAHTIKDISHIITLKIMKKTDQKIRFLIIIVVFSSCLESH